MRRHADLKQPSWSFRSADDEASYGSSPLQLEEAAGDRLSTDKVCDHGSSRISSMAGRIAERRSLVRVISAEPRFVTVASSLLLARRRLADWLANRTHARIPAFVEDLLRVPSDDAERLSHDAIPVIAKPSRAQLRAGNTARSRAHDPGGAAPSVGNEHEHGSLA